MLCLQLKLLLQKGSLICSLNTSRQFTFITISYLHIEIIKCTCINCNLNIVFCIAPGKWVYKYRNWFYLGRDINRYYTTCIYNMRYIRLFVLLMLVFFFEIFRYDCLVGNYHCCEIKSQCFWGRWKCHIFVRKEYSEKQLELAKFYMFLPTYFKLSTL